MMSKEGIWNIGNGLGNVAWSLLDKAIMQVRN
jgi:hypothetical protein